MMDNIIALEELYPDWKTGNPMIYRKMGENNHYDHIKTVEQSCCVFIPYNSIAIEAAYSGHIDLVLYCISKGINEFKTLIFIAEETKNENLKNILQQIRDDI